MNRRISQAASVTALLVFCFAGACKTSKRDGVVRVTGIPDENPTKLQQDYAPLVQILEKALGKKVEYVPVTNYGAAVHALIAGKVDFAWLGGFTHVQARTRSKVVPLVMRDIDRKFHSVFIANKSSGITKPEQMKGKKFAFGSKSSTSGHLMPRHFLKQKFQIDADADFSGKPVFSGAHDATVKAVESGRVDAGALNMQVWERMNKEGKVDASKVEVIWKTPPYVDYVWTARTAVSAELRDAFKKLFLSLDTANPTHKKVLDHAGATKYVPASPTDFDAIEKVGRAVGMLK